MAPSTAAVAAAVTPPNSDISFNLKVKLVMAFIKSFTEKGREKALTFLLALTSLEMRLKLSKWVSTWAQTL